MKKRNFYFTDKQIQGFETLTKKTGLTIAEHMRRAADEYLERKLKRRPKKHK